MVGRRFHPSVARRCTSRLGLVPVLIGGALAFGVQDTEPEPLQVPEGLPASLASSGASAERIELGRRLFFDPLLSADRSVSCSSCHDPEKGFADDRSLSVGVYGRETLRNAPTLYNRALGASFMWDGRATSLEEQVLLPIQNELEMDLALADALARVGSEPAYAAAFQRAFGAPVDEAHLAAALAAFVRRQLYGGSRVDRFRAGQRDALDAAELAGFWLYESRAGCWRCHVGANYTDEEFHNTGVGAVDGVAEEGRFAVTRDPEDRGRFKTPTLRGLAETAPYMHDGSFATLAEVVAFYRRGGRHNPNLDTLVAPLAISDEDAEHLVAFLRALSVR